MKIKNRRENFKKKKKKKKSVVCYQYTGQRGLKGNGTNGYCALTFNIKRLAIINVSFGVKFCNHKLSDSRKTSV